MINVGFCLFLMSFFSLLLKLIFSQYVDTSDLDLEYYDSSKTYIYDFVILCCCLLYFKYTDRVFRSVYYCFAILMLTFSCSTYLSGGDVATAVSSLLRWFLPFFLLAFYCSYFRKNNHLYGDFSTVISVVVVLCVIYGFVYFPMSTNRFDGDNDGFWWPAFFSNLHTTCYVAAAVIFIQYANYKRALMSLSAFVFLFSIVFLVVTFGWGIRTVSLLMLIFAYLLVYDKYLIKVQNYKLISAYMVSVFGVVWFFLYFDWDYYSRVTSGRLSMYAAKYEQLLENGLIEWLIGNGAGSDIIETSFWWGAKGAHSDLITSLVEGGIVFLVVFIYLHFVLHKISRLTNARYFVIPILFSGIVSNGYLSRPIAMYVLVIAFAGFYATSHASIIKKSGKDSC